ncbi:hypothetical protein RHGRI_016103 [Rhododendron griersonianum]|uniref:Uncharacterized protein n=1 Tax=Rhododendron griersonianum TaxID=479676 RepID=A0AAV6JSB8_9ERIC|nr:hypothetical protein RHGRI_016103 [Rhododendron griersonianum]
MVPYTSLRTYAANFFSSSSMVAAETGGGGMTAAAASGLRSGRSSLAEEPSSIGSGWWDLGFRSLSSDSIG